MALAHGLSSAGHTPTSVHTTAKVHLDRGSDGFAINFAYGLLRPGAGFDGTMLPAKPAHAMRLRMGFQF